MLEIWVSELTAEGGPHMVLVTTDEGVRYSDGTFLEPTASLADKVWQPDISIFWYSNILTSHILVYQYFDIVMFCTHCFLGCGVDVVPVARGVLKKDF